MNSKFSKKDLWYSVFAGVETGVIGWLVLDFLGIKLPAGLPLASLILIVPVLWIVGVNLGYILGQALPFFNQFGKFAAIGFTNFAVD